MVRAFKSVLIECEPTIKQIILDMNDQRKQRGEATFVIADFGERQVVIAPEFLEEIQARLESILEENSYQMKDQI
ncbi:RNA polymerase II transcription factor B subunit 5 [Hyaloraphidium curvatum]|nr:RNA polymerase II transcription factor B subunit 5 [Hyaloraphidium curvatum]